MTEFSPVETDMVSESTGVNSEGRNGDNMKAGNKIKKLVATYEKIYLSLKSSENEALSKSAGNIAVADLYINRYIYNEAIEKVEAFIKAQESK
jgi:hypothetical protein